MDSNIEKKVRVRYAPSPTGYLHVGGARTALFNYLFARHHGGVFILRMEDTDQKRSTDESAKQVLESMRWLGLDWDEGPEVGGAYGPYYQSERLDIYNRYFDQLLEQGLIYPCFCTEEKLIEDKEKAKALNVPNVYDRGCYRLDKAEVALRLQRGDEHTYRYKVAKEEFSIVDMAKGRVHFDTSAFGDFVVRRKDGFPTYNFAVVVDDAEMKISHVLRGDDHLSNTPKQILLFRALGFDIPIFGHVPMIMGEDRQKLSKRHGATSLLDFKEKGYLPEPMINFLSLLGWSPGDEKEIMNTEELIGKFSGDRLGKSASMFDYNKLDFFNGQYIRNMDLKRAVECFMPYLEEAFDTESSRPFLRDATRLEKIVSLARDYCKVLSDIKGVLTPFIDERYVVDQSCLHYLQTENAKRILSLAVEVFSSATSETIDLEEFRTLISRAKGELGIKGKDFFKPMRVSVTGAEEGYELDRFITTISRKSVLLRLERSRA